MVRPGTPILIPVETQTRELDAKLLFACVVAERGFPAVLGSQTEMHLRATSLPRGLYVAKDMSASKVRIFKILRALGHEIVAWEEEGLVPHKAETFHKRRLSLPAVNRVALFFSWGESLSKLLETYPACPDIPIEITGNPRGDMMRVEVNSFFDDEVEGLRARFGKFFLFNSNFGIMNHYFPNLSSLPPPDEFDKTRRKDGFTADYSKYRYTLFSEFQKLIPKLAEVFPDHSIIVRPHPAENHDVWKKVAAGHSNIHVIHEGNVVPWLLAASGLIHNGCTTAVEAFLLRKPAVAFEPVTSEIYGRNLPNTLSHKALNADEVISFLQKIDGGDLTCSDEPWQWAEIGQHIAALDGSLASDRIADAIERLDSNSVIAPEAGGFIGGWLEAHRRTLSKHINSLIPSHKNNSNYQRHRFPGVSQDEIQRKIALLQHVTGRFEGLKAKQLWKNIFSITG